MPTSYPICRWHPDPVPVTMPLIGLFWGKYARRIFAIVSTTSIPYLAPVSPTEATVARGSRLDADHPESGVLIPCVFTVMILLVSNLDAQRGLPASIPAVIYSQEIYYERETAVRWVVL